MHKPEITPDPDATALAEDLRRTVGNLVRAVRIEAATPKSAQSETLGLLDGRGASNIATLAQLRHVKHQTMRLILAQLEACGMVQRSTDLTDRRSQLFVLSGAGRHELVRGRTARASKMEAIIRESFTLEEREILRASIVLLARIGVASKIQ